MDRRTFLRRSSILVPGLSAAGLMGLTSQSLSAAATPPALFSLSVITDKPDKTLAMLQKLLNVINLPDKNIHYTEYKLHGIHVSDIAYTYSGRLLDFRNSDLPLCSELRKLSSILNMPYSCENPIMAHLSCNEGIQKPDGIRIFRQDELIEEKKFPVHTETVQIDGLNGKLVLELNENRSISVVETSCAHKTCMNMGSISQAGQNLVCIPNRIAVTINGKNISGVDSISF